ncbi:type II secretion system protein N [Pseudomonas aeruginosa]|uniref:type II secretion system protein N n=1 Tax=Pseudomonas aeruginosa TaxID=287 RepID=UPI000D69B0F2|nr:type II secretion system protein N [Pseudomonas aeruginosa]
MQRARLPESACCMSRHLPSSFVSLRSLAGHAPAVLCVLLLALLSASLASQTRSLRRELAELPAAAAPAPLANPSAAPRAALAGLFGGAPSPRGATAGERLQLRLLACFLARREDRSAALIAVAGRSQRFLPGAEVRPGTVLLAVHRDHVVLRDQGYEERLYFPKAEGAETTHATL